MSGSLGDGRVGDRGCGVLIVAKITQRTAGGYAEYSRGSQGVGVGRLLPQEGTGRGSGVAGGGAHLFARPNVPVAGEQLRTLLDVRRPDTGGELRRVGASGEAVAALDATFSAPKSVSAVWRRLTGAARRIEAAHEIAIGRALDYAVCHVRCWPNAWTRTRSSMTGRSCGRDELAAHHGRAVAIRSRPQLHSHAVARRAAARWSARGDRSRTGCSISARSARVPDRARPRARQLGFQRSSVARAAGSGTRAGRVPQPLLTVVKPPPPGQAASANRLSTTERDLRAVDRRRRPAAAGATSASSCCSPTAARPAEERLMERSPAPARSGHRADLDADWQHLHVGSGSLPSALMVSAPAAHSLTPASRMGAQGVDGVRRDVPAESARGPRSSAPPGPRSMSTPAVVDSW